jgi:diacylglycerol kinase (ATP)
MTLPLVIINPASAGGRTASEWPKMASDLRAHFGAFQVAFTKKAGDAARIALDEARQGRRFIIACGGDGTISETANGILESGCDTELGVLPSGTGGDFRRTLQMPTNASEAARALRRGRTIKIDVVRVNFTKDDKNTETRFLINVASMGMGGQVVARAKDDSWLSVGMSEAFPLGSKFVYAAAAAHAAVTFERTDVLIEIDGRLPAARRLRIANLCVANARYFGGGMKIAPDAKLNDGQFDVVAIGDLSAFEIFTNAYRLYLGAHLGMERVSHTRASRFSVRPVDKQLRVPLEIDGELVGHLPAAFEILPRALKIRAAI